MKRFLHMAMLCIITLLLTNCTLITFYTTYKVRGVVVDEHNRPIDGCNVVLEGMGDFESRRVGSVFLEEYYMFMILGPYNDVVVTINCGLDYEIFISKPYTNEMIDLGRVVMHNANQGK